MRLLVMYGSGSAGFASTAPRTWRTAASHPARGACPGIVTCGCPFTGFARLSVPVVPAPASLRHGGGARFPVLGGQGLLCAGGVRLVVFHVADVAGLDAELAGDLPEEPEAGGRLAGAADGPDGFPVAVQLLGEPGDRVAAFPDEPADLVAVGDGGRDGRHVMTIGDIWKFVQ